MLGMVSDGENARSRPSIRHDPIATTSSKESGHLGLAKRTFLRVSKRILAAVSRRQGNLALALRYVTVAHRRHFPQLISFQENQGVRNTTYRSVTLYTAS